MTTTIQIQDTTKQLLETLKKADHAKSYDQVIVDHIKNTSIAPSMFGSLKQLKPWKKEEDRLAFDEE